MTDVLSQWPNWRDKVVVELRKREVSGDEIGDILAEAEQHIRESRETPEEAFGNPAAYARNRGPGSGGLDPQLADVGMSWRLLALSIASAIGGIMAASAAWDIGAGHPEWGRFLPPWLALIIGLSVMFAPLSAIGPDLITDPRTGKPMFRGDQRLFQVVGAGFGLISLVVIAILGVILAG
jgi:hypothetical protein